MDYGRTKIQDMDAVKWCRAQLTHIPEPRQSQLAWLGGVWAFLWGGDDDWLIHASRAVKQIRLNPTLAQKPDDFGKALKGLSRAYYREGKRMGAPRRGHRLWPELG